MSKPTEKQLLTASAANVTVTIEIDATVNQTWNTMINDGWRQLYGEGGLKSFVQRAQS